MKTSKMLLNIKLQILDLINEFDKLEHKIRKLEDKNWRISAQNIRLKNKLKELNNGKL